MVPTVYTASVSAAVMAQCFVDKVNQVILFPLISLMMGVAFLIFLYGAFEYVRNADSQQGRIDGRNHLIWGIVGMLIMISAFAILNIAAGTFGLGIPRPTCGTGSHSNPTPISNTSPQVNTSAPTSNTPPQVNTSAPSFGSGSGFGTPPATGSVGSTPGINSAPAPSTYYSVMGQPTAPDQLPNYAWQPPAQYDQSLIDQSANQLITQGTYSKILKKYDMSSIPLNQRQDYLSTISVDCMNMNGSIVLVTDQAQTAGQWMCLQ